MVLCLGLPACEEFARPAAYPVGARVHPAFARIPGVHTRIYLSPTLRTLAARVKVSTGRSTTHPIEVLASLDVAADANGDVLDALRAEVLLLGGDAVLGVALHHDPASAAPWVTGVAVRFVGNQAEDGIRCRRSAFAYSSSVAKPASR